jgi:hypothetical protein
VNEKDVVAVPTIESERRTTMTTDGHAPSKTVRVGGPQLNGLMMGSSFWILVLDASILPKMIRKFYDMLLSLRQIINAMA